MDADHTQYDLALAALGASANGDYVPGDDPANVRFPCPVCGSSDSISLREGDNGLALVHCFSGDCEFGPIMDALGIEHGPQPVTLDTLADYLGVEVEWLEDEGWQDAPYTTKERKTVERVAIPYTKPEGDELVMHYRSRLSGGSKFTWQTRPRVHPKKDGLLYAYDDLAECEGKGVFLVEGESDALVLKKAGGHYTVGLPGAGMWDEDAHAPLFAKVATIYVPLELDTGGSKLLDTLRESSVREKVRIIRLPGANDVREFFAINRATFKARFDALLGSTQSIEQFGDVERAQAAATALANSGDIPANANRLELILDTIEANGLVGERPIAAAAALTFISCVGKKNTASAIIKGGSGGGKSYSEEHVREHFPPSYYRCLSNASSKSLYYLEPGSLSHKVLVLAEATGLESADGGSSGLAEAIRVLQSSGVLDYDTVVTNTGSLPQTVHVHQDGPTALLVTTTAVSIHPENETRCLSLSIDDSAEQTRRIIDIIGQQFAGNIEATDKTQWHAFFDWLRLTYLDAEVVVPFAPAVTVLIEALAMRLRRDISTMFFYVCAHALLHADFRERDDKGRIVATLDDYDIVVKYLGRAFTSNLDGVAGDQDKETVQAVAAILERKQADVLGLERNYVTYVELGKELGLDPSTAQRRAESAYKGRWLTNLETKRGRPAQVVLGEPIPEVEGDLLPTREHVEEAMHGG